jgi:hypothetical protein
MSSLSPLIPKWRREAHLLSPTHEDTLRVAYALGSFFAEVDRQNKAFTVINWLTEAHKKFIVVNHKRTTYHIFNVASLLLN